MMKMLVAVIGAGASGLCVARHLGSRKDIFKVDVFETGSSVGGTWIYTDLVGMDRHGMPIHSSMYKNLRTNLPKEVMQFPDFPFKKELPSFVHHTDVREYLRLYAQHYDLCKIIQFETVVESVMLAAQPATHHSSDNTRPRWTVTTRHLNAGVSISNIYDAVFVCSGHYADPKSADIPGIQGFTGKVMHSHVYREPEQFDDSWSVLCLGAGSSGQDISVELCSHVKKVFLSHNHKPLCTVLPKNMVQVPGTNSIHGNAVTLRDGSTITVDAILLCTGYNFTYPFLSPQCKVTVHDDYVQPLFKHLVHTNYHTLFFIGIPTQIIPFPMFDIQTRFSMSVLTGDTVLPSTEEMNADTENDLAERLAAGMPWRHAHRMGERQFPYNDKLCEMANLEPLARSVIGLYTAVHFARQNDITEYKTENWKITGPDTFIKLES